jgi:hypothetical protein
MYMDDGEYTVERNVKKRSWFNFTHYEACRGRTEESNDKTSLRRIGVLPETGGVYLSDKNQIV